MSTNLIVGGVVVLAVLGAGVWAALRLVGAGRRREKLEQAEDTLNAIKDGEDGAREHRERDPDARWDEL